MASTCNKQWDTCIRRFACINGEECWFKSDDYKKEFNTKQTEQHQRKNNEEIDLIATFDMEYGNSDNWTEETEQKFNTEWEKIQMKYRSSL